jgi:hypothetical protein
VIVINAPGAGYQPLGLAIHLAFGDMGVAQALGEVRVTIVLYKIFVK